MKPQCVQCGKKHHGQCWIRSYTSSHKEDGKEDGKVTEKETAREPKGRGKKGQRLNEITEPPEEQWTAGSWEQWSEQSWNTEADTASWRDDDWYTADSNS